MKKIAVIRPNRDLGSHVVKCISANYSAVVDIFDVRQIRVVEVSDFNRAKILLNGHAISSFDQVVMLGWPQSPLSGDDGFYARSEVITAATAALACSGVRLVRGTRLRDTSPYLEGALNQLSTLQSLGWETPSAMYQFNVSEIPKAVHSPPFNDMPRFLIVYTKQAYRVCSPAPLLGIPTSLLEERFESMTNHLFRTEQEWQTVPVTVWDGKLFASGLSGLVPRSLRDQALFEFVREILN